MPLICVWGMGVQLVASVGEDESQPVLGELIVVWISGASGGAMVYEYMWVCFGVNHRWQCNIQTNFLGPILKHMFFTWQTNFQLKTN